MFRWRALFRLLFIILFGNLRVYFVPEVLFVYIYNFTTIWKVNKLVLVEESLQEGHFPIAFIDVRFCAVKFSSKQAAQLLQIMHLDEALIKFSLVLLLLLKPYMAHVWSDEFHLSIISFHEVT